MERNNDTGISRIRIVVIEPVLPGNVGSIARAMANFGFRELVLVNPLSFDMKLAASFACNGDYILDTMRNVSSFEEAVDGASVIVGMTRRAKETEATVPVEDAARMILHSASSADAAIVFGRERCGLTEEEKSACTFLSHIDSVEGAKGSLNLAHAALVVMHEIHREARRRKIHAADIEPLLLSFERFCEAHHQDGALAGLFRSVAARAMLTDREAKKLKAFFEKCRKSSS
jgi:TrmH family RNA methyltransferase